MNSQSASDFLRALNEAQKRIVRRSWPYALGVVILSTASFSYVDFYHWDRDALYFWPRFLTWSLNYLLLLQLMKQGGFFVEGQASGIGTYFALGIITGILISLALVVLILPGLYLLMRWLPVYSRALTKGEWITQSMRWSWGATEPFQKPLSLSLLGPLFFYAVSIGANNSYDGSSVEAYRLAMFVTNFAENLGLAWLTIVGAASFAALAPLDSQGRPLAEVVDLD